MQSMSESNKLDSRKWAPLALGFRPFFLLGIWSAVLLIAASLNGFTAGWQMGYFDMRLWHAHEMLFGYATAVIAGFLLTAVRNWTGLPTPTGKALGFLAALWLLPRLLSVTLWVPATVYAALDLAFLPMLALVCGRLIVKAKQPHNYPIPLLLMLLALCNAGVHLEMFGIVADIANQSILIAVCLIMGLISVIAGRVVPFFMQSAIGTRPASRALIERLALPSILLFAASLATANPSATSHSAAIACALFAAVVHAVRLFSWFDVAVFKQPMLWVLHAGYAWLVAGFILFALAEGFGWPVTHVIHAWTAGGIGMFTLGMMARVALGHTGRPVLALPGMPAAFALVGVAALARVILPITNPALLDVSLRISASCWIIAFLWMGIRYSSILMLARADRKPG